MKKVKQPRIFRRQYCDYAFCWQNSKEWVIDLGIDLALSAKEAEDLNKWLSQAIKYCKQENKKSRSK